MRLSIPGAAFVNAAFASMLDLDDGHRAASGHPGAAVIPAVMATAEAHGADAERVLTAIAIGYEIGVRIAGARDVDTLHTFDSGLWCGQGAAAAAGWLRGLDPARLANAIAIAGTTAPGQTATAYTKLMGNNVKEGIPFATALGLVAVELAAAGFTGPVDFLDEEKRYDRSGLERRSRRPLADRDRLFQALWLLPLGACRHRRLAAADGAGAPRARRNHGRARRDLHAGPVAQQRPRAADARGRAIQRPVLPRRRRDPRRRGAAAAGGAAAARSRRCSPSRRA